jgi:hypothetical protein
MPYLVRYGEWRNADETNAARFPDDAMAVIQENLTRLIRDYPALDRYRKARRMASVTGNRLRQIELICDARPVFDQDRQRIEGFVPLMTLKLVYETQAEDTDCIEVILSADMLEDLLEKGRKVQRKVSVLRDSLNQLIPDGLVNPGEE